MAWDHTITEDYCSQRVNSERSLQAAFWYQICNQLPDNRRTFIEPAVRSKPPGRAKRFRPDIVICSISKVIAVVEIKYKPRALPTFNKDIKTLQTLSKYKAGLWIENNRYLGPARDPRKYHFSTNVLFVWAGIHRYCKDGSYNCAAMSPLPDGCRYLSGCFFRLHAETAADGDPNVFSRFD